MQRLSIAVAGAGVGGLAVAAGLAGAGHRVRLFDRFDRPRPVGSGLVIQPVGQAVLQALGALEDAWELGHPIERLQGRDAGSSRQVLAVSYAPRRGLAIHRAALFDVLLGAATRAGVKVETGHTVVGREDKHLLFQETTRAGPFDLIVDACGGGSPLSPLVSRTLPFGALWANVDWPQETQLPTDALSQVYRRASKMVGVLPIGRAPGDQVDRAAIFWSLPTAQFEAWQDAGLDAWRDEACALWPEYGAFAGQITAPQELILARYAHGTLRHVTAPGLAHIGDAAHRASPQLGQGANMALLDALALARAIERTEGQLPVALQWYAEARRRHMLVYQTFSRVFTPLYQSESVTLPWLRDRVLAPMSLVPPMPRILSRLVSGDLVAPLGSLEREA